MRTEIFFSFSLSISYSSKDMYSVVRLSNHDLMVEKGRHLKFDKTQRVCPFCPSSTETKLHFLLHRKTFSAMRVSLWSEIQDTIEISDQTSDQEKCTILLSNEFVAAKVGHFLHKAFSIRKFLLSKPKNKFKPLSKIGENRSTITGKFSFIYSRCIFACIIVLL